MKAEKHEFSTSEEHDFAHHEDQALFATPNLFNNQSPSTSSMIPLPPLEFFTKGMEYAGRGGQVGGYHVNLNETSRRCFKSFFGVTAGGCAAVWNELISFPTEHDQKVEFFNLLWACMFVKLYSPISVLSGIVKVDEKTFSKWVWILLCSISVHVKPKLIHLGLRFERSNGARQLLSIDGTDCPTNMRFDRSFYSHKFKGEFLLL